MKKINLLFDTDESVYFIRLGTFDVLEKIQSGSVWFRTLKYYREKYEDTTISTIGDKYEGVNFLAHPEKCDSIKISFPSVNNGESHEIKNQLIGPVTAVQNDDYFISCYSYFNFQNMENKTIIHNNYLLENDWDHVLIFFDFYNYITSIRGTVSPNPVYRGIVKYLDFKDNQDSIDVFNKSDTFKWQKEYRIAISKNYLSSDKITKIDEDTIEIKCGDVNSVIVPRSEINTYCKGKRKFA